MKVLFLKYMVDRRSGQGIKNALEMKERYLYDTPEALEDKVFYWFNSKERKNLQVLVLGYDSRTRVIMEGWLGEADLIGEDSVKISISNGVRLKSMQITYIENLFQNMSSYNERLQDVKSYMFMRNMTQDIFYDIIYDLRSSNLHNSKKSSLVMGKYKKLKKGDIDDIVLEVEERLHPLAQKSYMAKRAIGIKKPDKNRTEFQRDKDRIIHSKAFRRAVDKAQVYSPTKGDHYRTRLTHTLEVNQIAVSIARSLKLNEDLVEAIALGHDIGHTPFGHQGERQIDLILTGKVKLDSNHIPENLGGFKHNYQSLKLANYSEEKYLECEGLDLTYQVLEGILKHTKTKKCKNGQCSQCCERCFDIDEFLIIGDKKELYLENNFCSTMEGQIVYWADEIAQRGHDLDDGIAGKLVDIYELYDELKQYHFMNPVVEVIRESLRKIKDSKRELIDKQEMLRISVTPKIIRILINDIVNTSKKHMEDYLKKYDFNDDFIIKEEVIGFSEDGKKIIDKLEQVINLQVINSQEVNCFDGKAMYIIKKLFQAYYNNPKQLPDHTLRRIQRELKDMNIKTVDIRKDNKDAVEKEILIFKGIISTENRKNDFIKKKVFMRNIADLIGGMTDNFANARFRELYNGEYK